MPSLPLGGGIAVLLIAGHAPGVDNPFCGTARDASGEQLRQKVALLFHARTTTAAGELFIGNGFSVCL